MFEGQANQPNRGHWLCSRSHPCCRCRCCCPPPARAQRQAPRPPSELLRMQQQQWQLGIGEAAAQHVAHVSVPAHAIDGVLWISISCRTVLAACSLDQQNTSAYLRPCVALPRWCSVPRSRSHPAVRPSPASRGRGTVSVPNAMRRIPVLDVHCADHVGP